MLKKTLFILYILVLIVMGAATFVESARGTGYVAEHVYGSWWFAGLWAVLAAAAIAYFIKRRVRRASLVALHLSFVVILIGALLTHLFAEQGTIHLRIGETSHTYMVSDNTGVDVPQRLPFEMTLNAFDILYHEGTTSVADYVSTFTIDDGGETLTGRVSMNKIFSHRSIRIYQMSYDTDGQGARLSVNIDPWGISVTYVGYALLFLSLAWMLFDPKGGFCRALRELSVRQKALTIAVMLLFAGTAQAQSTQTTTLPHTLPQAMAEQFGKLYVMYNGRICPMQTLAIDFTKKLYGKSSYRGYTAEQVLAGFLFWPQEWEREPIIRLKGSALRDRLQLPKYVPETLFFNRDMGGYILGPYVAEYYKGNGDKFHEQVTDVDDRLQLIMDVHRGAVLKIFPYQDVHPSGDHNDRPRRGTPLRSSAQEGTPLQAGSSLGWYSPIDDLPETMEPDRQRYIHGVLRMLYDEIHAGNETAVHELLTKMLRYQRVYGGTSLPSPAAVKAERLYNAVPFATILFIVNLTAGMLALVALFFGARRRPLAVLHVIAALSLLALTLCLALRWVVSGTVPMANGYETMLLTAWLVLLLTVVLCRRLPMVLAFGLLLSGFFLLVSHISQMNPSITHVMPVLSSPLLCIHVSLIMMSFALLSLTFINSVTAIVTHIATRRHGDRPKSATAYDPQLLTMLFLYPALALLGIGIFVGAIWANVSWGTYWSWDPKEVWALITLMVYAAAVHTQTLPAMRRPLTHHVVIAAAFLTVVMTYFGVNYLLGGMHSYA